MKIHEKMTYSTKIKAKQKDGRKALQMEEDEEDRKLETNEERLRTLQESLLWKTAMKRGREQSLSLQRCCSAGQQPGALIREGTGVAAPADFGELLQTQRSEAVPTSVWLGRLHLTRLHSEHASPPAQQPGFHHPLRPPQ